MSNNEMVEFDFELGLIYRTFKNGNTKIYGEKSNHNDGYCRVQINGKKEYIHRKLYSSYHDIPLKQLNQIDHIDMNKMNNSINNLRVVTCSENGINKNKNKNNSSGYKNIYWYKQNEKWLFIITINGKRTQKYFNELQEVIQYRDAFYKTHPIIKYFGTEQFQ